MVLAFSMLFMLTAVTLPLVHRHLGRTNFRSIPISHEISTAGIMIPLRQNKTNSSSFFDSFTLGSGVLEKSTLHRNKLRLYSIFEWVSKFEEEDRLLNQAQTYLRQARKEFVRRTMVKAVLVFQASIPLVRPDYEASLTKNKNLLRVQIRHSFAYP